MKMILNGLISAVIVFSLLLIPMFFSIAAIIGIDYEGSEDSSAYIMYTIAVFVLSFLSYIYSSIKKGVLKNEMPILLSLFILIASHFVWVIFDQNNTTLFTDSFVLFVLLGLPGIFSAVTMVKMGLINQVVKLTEVGILVIVVAIISYSILPTLTGIKTASLGGASYQTLSYYSSMSFGVLLIYITQLSKSMRYSWTSSIIYKSLAFIILTSCLIGVFIGGGRGAFILLVIYLIIWLLSTFRIKKILSSTNYFIKSLISLSVLVFTLSVFLNFFWEKDFISSGFKRATQFISTDGSLDLESGSSGRDVVYSNALEYINHQPFLGYGPFGALDNTLQAHNIFLDVLLQFGFLGLICFLVLILLLSIKAINNWSIQSVWMFSLFLYPLIQLMFSAYYLQSSLFLFGLTFFTIHKRS